MSDNNSGKNAINDEILETHWGPGNHVPARQGSCTGRRGILPGGVLCCCLFMWLSSRPSAAGFQVTGHLLRPANAHPDRVKCCARGDEECAAVLSSEGDVGGPGLVDVDVLYLLPGAVEHGYP